VRLDDSRIDARGKTEVVTVDNEEPHRARAYSHRR
jgi:hypothetical protein